MEKYTSYLKDNAIKIPDDVEYVWLRTKVRKQTYSYEYSFDGAEFIEIPVVLDAAVLSDDYVLQKLWRVLYRCICRSCGSRLLRLRRQR